MAHTSAFFFVRIDNQNALNAVVSIIQNYSLFGTGWREDVHIQEYYTHVDYTQMHGHINGCCSAFRKKKKNETAVNTAYFLCGAINPSEIKSEPRVF